MGPEMRKSVYITGAVDEKQLLRNEYLPLSAKFYLASLVTRAFIQTSSTNERGSHENQQHALNRTPDCGGSGA